MIEIGTSMNDEGVEMPALFEDGQWLAWLTETAAHELVMALCDVLVVFVSVLLERAGDIVIISKEEVEAVEARRRRFKYEMTDDGLILEWSDSGKAQHEPSN